DLLQEGALDVVLDGQDDLVLGGEVAEQRPLRDADGGGDLLGGGGVEAVCAEQVERGGYQGGAGAGFLALAEPGGGALRRRGDPGHRGLRFRGRAGLPGSSSSMVATSVFGPCARRFRGASDRRIPPRAKPVSDCHLSVAAISLVGASGGPLGCADPYR